VGVLVIRFVELSCAKHVCSMLASPSHAATLFRRSLEKGKMSKTPEEMAAEFSKFEATYGAGSELLSYRQGLFEGFLAGYKAAQDQVADVSKVITYDYVETASNEAKELIAEFGLEGDEDVLIKALVAAYCGGVDAVDGYLRNSLSAYRASVKSQQWISVKDRLPDKSPMVLAMCTDGYELAYYGMYGQGWTNTLGTEHLNVTHWHPLPAPPKEEK
jgi:hypothetical protein